MLNALSRINQCNFSNLFRYYKEITVVDVLADCQIISMNNQIEEKVFLERK